MKIRLFALTVMLMIMFACQTKEEKALKLIKDDLFKTLYDFASYEPIEISIDSAFTTIYRDTIVVEYAKLVENYIDAANKGLEKTRSASRTMEIWEKTYTLYGLRQYDAALEEYKVGLKEAEENMEKIKDLRARVNERAVAFETEFIGWRARHKFRCKTRGGLYSLPTYDYVFDFKLKEIIYKEDTEDEELVNIRGLIDELLQKKDEQQ